VICSHGLIFTLAFASLGFFTRSLSSSASTPMPVSPSPFRSQYRSPMYVYLASVSFSFSPYDFSSGACTVQRTFAWRFHSGLSYPAGSFNPCATCANLGPYASQDLLWSWSTWADGCHRGLRRCRINYWPRHLVDAFRRPLRVCSCRTAASSARAAKYFLICV